jgi:glutamate-1-semialdehyde 2,1-aminomutase
MEQIAPAGPIYQAGTLSGNPLAMAAGLATLHKLNRPGVYEELEKKSAYLSDGIGRVLGETGANYTQTRVGSMFSLFFSREPAVDDGISRLCDLEMFNRYFRGMLKRGIYLAPSQFEAGFISLAHSDEDIDKTIEAVRNTFIDIRR